MWQDTKDIPPNRYVIVKIRKLDGRFEHYSGRMFISRYIPATNELQLFPGFGTSLDWVEKWHEIPKESKETK